MPRRYGVRSARRYLLTAASVVLMGVLGYCQFMSSSTKVVAESPVFQSEYEISQNTFKMDDEKLVAANTKFGFKLFSEILKTDADKNVFVSPSSVAIALAMTYNGASGSTQQAMAKALELQGLSLEQINSSNAVLKEFLENPDPKVQLTIANSLWARQNFPFKPEFLQTNQEFYKAEVSNLDFSDPGSPAIINNWVKEKTSGKIDKIVEEITPEQVLFLINAIYFKGSWTEKFDKNTTANYPFNLISGEQKQHPMMSQTGDYKYYETEEFQAASLPYGDNGRISFYIFLPKQNSSLTAFYQNLNTENWEQWMTKFSKREGFIRLPRFKMVYNIELNQALKALGMEEAFSKKADFSAMSEEKLFIDTVQHKTFVEVNEEGTEAAAVTSVGVRTTSVQLKPEPFQMIVDRPFFCAIRDNQTGSVLFMGSIVNPESSD
ncbi:serpin family protein [Brasilonema bromeliae]|uniref:Serpin family protein n=1 Tax=Brasilonema bromeliae SPC951 TaxID=385972 RepID=A0ABX1PB79_9CYAN|nr:serpin family protein [Brasilonema bromeliae]NMG21559.1 serpin family protein [Brasilonema bromeliae SPC951]